VPIYANTKVEEFMLCHNACIYSPSCSCSIMQARVYTLSMSSPVRAGTVIQVHVTIWKTSLSQGVAVFVALLPGGLFAWAKTSSFAKVEY
jgi:hypothetical protein